jgi:hypothetical protein
MRLAACTIAITVYVDADEAEGDEFEMAVAAVHDALVDFRLDAITEIQVVSPDDLAIRAVA